MEIGPKSFPQLLDGVNMIIYESTSSPPSFFPKKLLFTLQPSFDKGHFFEKAFPNGHPGGLEQAFPAIFGPSNSNFSV